MFVGKSYHVFTCKRSLPFPDSLTASFDILTGFSCSRSTFADIIASFKRAGKRLILRRGVCGGK